LWGGGENVGAARGREKGEGGKEGTGGREKVVGETTEGVLSDRNSKVLLDWDGIQFPQRLRLILTEDLKVPVRSQGRRVPQTARASLEIVACDYCGKIPPNKTPSWLFNVVKRLPFKSRRCR
jgi:hypothetical protein